MGEEVSSECTHSHTNYQESNHSSHQEKRELKRQDCSVSAYHMLCFGMMYLFPTLIDFIVPS